jgi:beta-lactamase regulating signal transducer with metallopeptidase domain
MSEFLNAPGFVPSLVMKVTLVLTVGSVVALLLQKANASSRHAIWALTLGGALVLPLCMVVVPSWRVRVLSPEASVANVAPSSSVRDVAATPRAETSTTTEDPKPTFTTRGPLQPVVTRSLALPFLWLGGALAILLWMAIGRLALSRIARRAESLDSQAWRDVLERERLRAGVTKTVILLSTETVSTPLTWGIRSPVILLPADSADWCADHRDVVIRHEMAHIARGDSITQMLGTIVCAVYWFHPLVWIAARGMRAEQERACDDRVLSSGTSPVAYAGHLLEVARTARALGPQGFVSLAMARPSQLEGRLLAVLNGSRKRSGVSPLTKRLSVAAAVIAIVTLSAFTPIARPAVIRAVVAPTIIATQFATPLPPIAASKAKAASATLKTDFDSTFEKSVTVRENGTLVLDLETGGGLTITGWDQSRVQVSGRLAGRNWRDTEVRLEQTGTGARLTSRQRARGSSSTSHHFDIHVPRRFSIDISSAGGGVSINGVDGTFSGTTGGGTIEIENAGGRARLSTGGGNIRVYHSRMSGSVSTGGGMVYIQDNDGDLHGSSGSGPTVYSGARSGTIKGYDDNNSVTISGSGASISVNEHTGEIRDRNGRIIYRKAGGDVNVAEAMSGADIRTGGGAVIIGRSAGDVSVSTGGGGIRIGPLAGSAMAHTGAGDVIVDLRGSRAPSADITSGNGRVEITLPRNFSGTLDLETAYTDNLGHRTRINSDWPLSINESADWDDSHGTPRKYVRARRTFGGAGGVISVRTVNGDIVIRRE